MEETTFEAATHDESGYPSHQGDYQQGGYQGSSGGIVKDTGQLSNGDAAQSVKPRGAQSDAHAQNGAQYNNLYTPAGGRYSRTVQFPDELNKSDIEKVRERTGERTEQDPDLVVLYTARGR